MSCTGYFTGYCPKGASERIDLTVELACLNWENDAIRDDVIAAACRGTVCYFAIKRTKKSDGSFRVFATVCKTEYVPAREEFLIKVCDEVVGPVWDDCPLRILKLLTGTRDEYATGWRRRCLAKLGKKHYMDKDGVVHA